MKKQKIIIADNNKYFREGLKRILLNIGNVKIIGEVENGLQLLELLENEKADIVFLDVAMTGMGGFEATLIGHRKFPNIRFIAFSSLENQRYINKMITAGVSGYLAKSNDNYDLLHEIVNSKEERFYLSPGLQTVNLRFDNHSLVN
ncbi:MAG: response regulator transcription factor [Bacteroidales bacterium]|nr:response regulator transcription factor [Bacteroidales bacterium]